LRAAWILAFFLACSLVACADESSGARRDQPENLQLPGESPGEAFRRIYDRCMDGYDIPFTTLEAEGKEGTFMARGYDTTSNGYVSAHLACLPIASAVVPTPSRAELLDSYQLELEFLACLDSAGFETGTPVSEDEWIASGGLADPSSNWSVLANSNDPAFNTAYTACFTSGAAEG